MPGQQAVGKIAGGGARQFSTTATKPHAAIFWPIAWATQLCHAQPSEHYERGALEKTAARLGLCFPDWTGFRAIAGVEGRRVAALLNFRPRNRLGDRTLAEVFLVLRLPRGGR